MMHPTEIHINKQTDKEFQLGQRKRKYRRARISGFIGDLVDGQKIIGGLIENISTGGFEMSNLPKSFIAEKSTYTTVLSGAGRHYKMLAKPCWSKKNGGENINIGFKILDAPWEWVEFTLQEIPETNE